MDLTIRTARLEDAELLCRLNQTVHDLHVQARPDHFKPYAMTSELLENYRERLHDAAWRAYIGELDGEPIGFVLIQEVRRPENAFQFALDYLLVDQISVRTEYQSRGYGQQLMDKVIRDARERGFSQVILNVWTFNMQAVRFYERLGFKPRDVKMEMILDDVQREQG